MGNTVPAVGFAVGVICSGFLNGSRVEPQDQSDYENKYKFYTPKSVSRIYIYLWYFTIITSETFVCDQEFRVHIDDIITPYIIRYTYNWSQLFLLYYSYQTKSWNYILYTLKNSSSLKFTVLQKNLKISKRFFKFRNA